MDSLVYLVFLFVFTIACLGTIIFQCLPVHAIWNLNLQPPMGTARCYSDSVYRSIGLFNGAINIITDVLFASMPIPVILALQVNLRTKITLIAILSLGYFACIAGIVREVLLSNFFKNPDNFFNDTYLIWMYVETNIGILAACLPALRPIFAFILETASTFKTSRTRRKTGTQAYYGQDSRHSIKLGSIPSRERQIRKETTIVVSRGPMSKLEASIGELDNGSEEYIIAKGNDQRV